MLTILEGIFNRISNTLGHISSVLFLLLVANVVYDVLMRYVFNDVSIAFQEMEWHLFSAVFLLGVPYAIKTGGHVRVDIFYERFSPRVQAVIDIFGTLVWLLPFSLLVAWYGIDFAYQAYDMGETSGDPGGLPYRWIIKAVIPISFLFIAISGLGLLCKSLNQFLNPNTHNKEEA